MSMPTGQVSKLKNTGYNQVTMNNKNSAQNSLFNMGAQGLEQGFPQILQQLMQMAQGGNEEMWGKLEAPALRQFGQAQGQLASRFSGMGMGGRRSSAHQNAQTGLATDLSERLQANRMGLSQQAQQQVMQMYQNLMGQDMQTNALIQEPEAAWKTLLNGIGGVAGNVAGSAGGFGFGKLFGAFK